ncbi:MAG: putative glycoside hydrolase [Acidimicrobiia bacterium]
MARLLPLLALVLSACVATPPIVMGEAAPPMTMPPDEMVVEVLDHTGTPLAGALVAAATDATEEAVPTGPDGRATVRWIEGGVELVVDGPAHQARQIPVMELPPAEGLSVQLEPTVVEGVVTGIGGHPLAAAAVTLGDETVMTDDAGRFRFLAAEPGEVSVERPAYLPTTATAGEAAPVTIGLEPRTVRGLYVNPGKMAGEDWERILEAARRTEINTLVIDIKSESGKVYYDTDVPLATEISSEAITYDPVEVRRQLDELGVYLIGRVVAFQDPIAAQARPDMSIIDSATGQPFNARGQWFLDPTDTNARQYNLDLAIDACEAGIDEIQFDYVRFPYNIPETGVVDGSRSDEARPQVIRDFLATARDELHDRGCAVSADIFGFITRERADGGIGQNLEMLAEVTDALSPMMYPSHYSTGWYGFEVPNDHPGPVVAGAMDEGLERIGDDVILRPWFQDFWYDASQVRAQIDEADARGVGWMLWHPGSNFTYDALRPAA